MGMDFVALMKYGGPDERVLRALDRLEAGSPEPLRAVRRLMEARRFFNGEEEAAVWEFRHRGEVRDPRLDGRPRLPRLSATLSYTEIPGDQVMRTVTWPSGRRRTESMAWDRDRPPPEGWEREISWDSHGYWRLILAPPAQALTGPPTSAPLSEESPRPKPVRAASRMDDRRWATSGEPDAMLEWLLKQDGGGERKVR